MQKKLLFRCGETGCCSCPTSCTLPLLESKSFTSFVLFNFRNLDIQLLSECGIQKSGLRCWFCRRRTATRSALRVFSWCVLFSFSCEAGIWISQNHPRGRNFLWSNSTLQKRSSAHFSKCKVTRFLFLWEIARMQSHQQETLITYQIQPVEGYADVNQLGNSASNPRLFLVHSFNTYISGGQITNPCWVQTNPAKNWWDQRENCPTQSWGVHKIYPKSLGKETSRLSKIWVSNRSAKLWNFPHQ